MTVLTQIQNAAGKKLIPAVEKIRKESSDTEAVQLATACEMFYVAYSMKRAPRQGALFIARHYCGMVGLDGHDVERFTRAQIIEVSGLGETDLGL